MNAGSTESKGSCNHCAGHFIFPGGGIGEKIKCPHCGRETILLPIIEITPRTTPAPVKKIPAGQEWIYNIKNDRLREAAKGFHALFSIGLFLFLIAVGTPLVIFAFIEFMRFLHLAWGRN